MLFEYSTYQVSKSWKRSRNLSELLSLATENGKVVSKLLVAAVQEFLWLQNNTDTWQQVDYPHYPKLLFPHWWVEISAVCMLPLKLQTIIGGDQSRSLQTEKGSKSTLGTIFQLLALQNESGLSNFIVFMFLAPWHSSSCIRIRKGQQQT